MTETLEVEPVSASSDGRRNAYVHHCEVVGQRRAFATCQRLIAFSKDKLLEILYTECMAAIKRGSCPALKMQKDEVAAGHAIYFEPRHADMPVTVHVHKAPRRRIEPAAPPAAPSLLDAMDNTTYADVLNKVVAAPEVKRDTVNVVAKPVTQMGKALPGETLVEMAKRLLADRSTKKE